MSNPFFERYGKVVPKPKPSPGPQPIIKTPSSQPKTNTKSVPVNKGVIKHIENVKTQVETRKNIAEKIISNQPVNKKPSPGPQPIIIKTPDERIIPQEIIDNQPVNKKPSQDSKPKPSHMIPITTDIELKPEPKQKPYDYLIRHSPKETSKNLKMFEKTMYSSMSIPTFKKVTDKVFDISVKSAVKNLPPEKREEFSYLYTDWESIPVEERKFYLGSKTYFKNLSKKEKETMSKKYLESESFEKYISSPKGEQELSAIAKSLQEKEMKEKYGPFAVSSVSIYDYDKAKKELAFSNVFKKTSVFKDLGLRTKYKRSFIESGTSAAAFPITLFQTGVKYVTGKGSYTDPISRIQTGKTFLPDVNTEIIEPVKIGAPSGLISTTISEGIGFATGKKSGEFKKYMDDPVAGGFATAGEIAGFMVAGKLVNVGKVKAFKGLKIARSGIISKTGWNVPGYSSFMKYRPSNIARTIWWKGKEKLGYAKYVPEEQVWHPDVLASKTKFAEASSPQDMIKDFYKTKAVSGTDDILGIHAAPHRFNPLTYVKKGTSETPGLSVSAYGKGSPHFLKVSGYTTKAEGISLFPQFYRPTAPVFNLRDVFRIPKGLRGASYKQTGKYILKQPKGPYAWVAPKAERGGPEIEAIIRAGTIGARKSSYYYTTYKGMTIPLPRYKLFGKGISSTAKTSLKYSPYVSKSKDFISLSYYGGSKPISIISPSMLISKSLYYSKPFTISSSYKKLFSSSIKPASYTSSAKSYLSSGTSYSSGVSYTSSGGSSAKSYLSSGTSYFPYSPTSSFTSYKPSSSTSYTSSKPSYKSSFTSYKPSSSTSYSKSKSSYSPSKYKSGLYKYGDEEMKFKKPKVDKKLYKTKYKFRSINVKSPFKPIKLSKGGLF